MSDHDAYSREKLHAFLDNWSEAEAAHQATLERVWPEGLPAREELKKVMATFGITFAWVRADGSLVF